MIPADPQRAVATPSQSFPLPHDGVGEGEEAKVEVLPVNVEAIPDVLGQIDRWVCWRRVMRGGRATKVPVDAKRSTHNAAVDDPTTWGTFEEAVACYQRGGVDGIGLVLTGDDDLLAFDLDHCRDATTGAIEDWAQEIIDTLNTYTEISPSGTGIRLLARGRLPGKRRRCGRVEAYETGRYVTITGWQITGDTHDDD